MQVCAPGDEYRLNGELHVAPKGGITRVVMPRLQIEPSALLRSELRRLISEVSQTDKGTLRIKLHDKLAALDKLARALGMYHDDTDTKTTTPPLVARTVFKMPPRLHVLASTPIGSRRTEATENHAQADGHKPAAAVTVWADRKATARAEKRRLRGGGFDLLSWALVIGRHPRKLTSGLPSQARKSRSAARPASNVGRGGCNGLTAGESARGSPPEVLEAVRGQLGVAHRVLDILVPEVGLQRAGIVPGVGAPARPISNSFAST